MDLKVKNGSGSLLKRLLYNKYYYLMLLPAVVLVFIFRYLPMGGLIIAFQKFNIFKGIFNSPWVGLQNFRNVFSSPDFFMVMKNTVLISVYRLIFGFPIPIILALMLNELKNQRFKKSIQTIIYLPHFISWVVISGIMLSLFSPSEGAVAEIFRILGFEYGKFNLMVKPEYFRSILVISNIWKESGWGTIIYLASLSTIDQNLFEAARVDGAKKFRQIWHITLPCISPIIILLLILQIGSLMEAGFEQILILQNDLVRGVSEIFDTYVYRYGIRDNKYSFTTAIGVFKSVVSMILLYSADKAAKLIGEEGLL